MKKAIGFATDKRKAGFCERCDRKHSATKRTVGEIVVMADAREQATDGLAMYEVTAILGHDRIRIERVRSVTELPETQVRLATPFDAEEAFRQESARRTKAFAEPSPSSIKDRI